MGMVALCLDGESCLNPSLIGLDGEALDSQKWLMTFSDAACARNSIEGNSYDEVWVVSSDDMEAINLAAALKQDNPAMRVCLVGPSDDGSLHSRAYTAGIDMVYDQTLFVRAYTEAKRQRACLDDNPSIQQGQSVGFAVRPVNPIGRTALLVPVVSGSGGTGKSIVAALFALVCAQVGMKTLLIDYDLQFGDEASLLGWDSAPSLDELVHGQKNIADLPFGPFGLSLLAAPRRLETAEQVVRAMPAILDELLQRFDIVVANTGAAWAEQHAVLLERSSVGLFLVDQRSTSVRACKHALELCERCNIATGPFRFALNRCAKNAPLTSLDVSCALGGQPVFDLRDGGYEIEECMAAGAVPELLRGKNELCASVKHVVASLVVGADSLMDVGKPKVASRRRNHIRLRRNRGQER